MIGRKKGRGRRGAGEGGGGGKKIIYLNGSVPVPQLIITSCSLMTKYSRKLYSLLVHVYTLRVLYGHLVSHKFYIFELKLISISYIFVFSNTSRVDQLPRRPLTRVTSHWNGPISTAVGGARTLTPRNRTVTWSSNTCVRTMCPHPSVGYHGDFKMFDYTGHLIL